jgi:hypothetical protein
MEKNMSRVQPQALTNEELMSHIYAQNYNVSVDFVKEMYERFSALVHFEGFPTKDPRQLELPL